ncbi:MAG: GAF domain-containing protein [Betaproteobacteria bacterium]|nr:GAF domain-containing protein [Betaproteobacteria bacterium]
MRFERLVSGISAQFIAAPIVRMEDVIVDALRRIVETLGVDRCTLSSVDPRTGAFHATHSWAAAGFSPVPRTVSSRTYPWALARFRAGLPVVFSRVADLPPEAADDAASYAGIGLGAHVGVPVLVSGEFLAVLGVAAMRDERAWTDGFVARMRLLAEVFGSALARHAAEERARQATAQEAHARERLAHLARVDAVGAMSAAIAHEINQPLMAIENYAHAGRRRLSGAADVDRARLDELFDKIAGQASLASEVIDRLRELVRRREVREAWIDVAGLIGNALPLIEIECRQGDVRVETAVAPGLAPAFGDEIQVQQVVMNLAHNAIDAMLAASCAERTLRIEAAPSEEGGVEVRVADRGPGIADDDREKVYDPFYTTKGNGLGIGLSICRTIVEAHGGRLWHDRNPGGGTVFRFTLPDASDGA